MAFTVEDAQALDAKLNDPSTGVIKRISDLASADADSRKQHIIPLIGSIISLIITAIVAAID